ncbi:hypothetical protein ACFQY0_10290 [Haloferula chungangensis]|uniref:Uncharacterized protein n=1 Tax=Haloferula chungangensis TaxID=1048331 RepID=A0ABW2L905_9BACT
MKPPKNTSLLRCLVPPALVLAVSITVAQAAPIEFLAAEGFGDGDLNGQQGWVASTGKFLSNQVDAAAGVVTSQNGEIAVFDSPLNLEVGESFRFSATFQFVDFTATGLTPPAAGEFWYMLRTGLKETNAATTVANGAPSGITRLQAFDGNVRLLNNAFGAGTAGGTGSALALDTPYTISYEITLGADAESTSFSISLSDGTATASGTIIGISPTLYDDLATGDGAYVFFQSDGAVQGGIDAIQLLSVDISGSTPPPSGTLIDFLAAEGFSNGDLNGQQGWTATTGKFLSNQVDAATGIVTSQNSEIAVYDTAYNLAVGETFSFSASFKFADFTVSGLTPPGFEEFWTMARTGLKETNAATMVDNSTPNGTAKFQAYENNVRLLDNGFTPATSGTGSPVALGTTYTITYSLTMGADAATTSIAVSLSDGVTTVPGTITGISDSLYTDLASGDGAHLFFQADVVVQGGIDAIQIDTIQIEGATPPPSEIVIDFLAAEGFSNGDLNGQQGWIASDAKFLSNQVNATTGLVVSQNSEIAVYDTAYNLAVGDTLHYSTSFSFANFNGGELTPPGAEEFWTLLRIGLKETNNATMVANGAPSGVTKFQAFENNVRLLDNAFTPATPGTGSALALATPYTINYSITLGADAASTSIAVSLNDGAATVSGTITGISDSLYSDLATGDGAYLFFQSDGVVQGGIEAIQVDVVRIEAPEVIPSDGIVINSVSYQEGVGFTINYTSGVGPVDVWFNDSGTLDIDDFFLLDEDQTGGTYTDNSTTPKAFYILTTAGEAP